MSNYSVLKQDINNNIYENQTQQITGTVLNAILNEMTASLGAGYQFAGVATLGMNPGDPDQRVFYLAGEGIYTSFGGIQVPAGKLGVLKWDNRWTLQTIDGLGGGGANLTGYVSVASTDDLPDEGVATLGYLCGTNLYLYVGEGGDTKEGKYQDCGSFRGPQGDSVQDVEQTQTSLENGGVNKIKFTLSNGISCEFQVRNGTTSSGLFPTLQALQAAYPSPVVGQYAFVGAGFPADIYVCTTAGTWTDSGEDYDGDNVDLTDYATKAEVNQLEAKVNGYVRIPYTEIDSDTAPYPVINYRLSGQGAWVSPGKTIIVPVADIDTTLTIIARNEGTAYKYGLLKSNTVTSGAVADFCTGHQVVAVNVPTPTTFVKANLPSDCNYICIVYKQVAADPYTVDYVDITHPGIGTEEIKDGAITTNKLASASVTTDKIADGAVSSGKIADGAINESKIANESVNIDAIKFKTTIEGPNKANPSACVSGYVNMNTGAIGSASTRYATDFIPVSMNGLYCNGANGYGGAGYNAVYDSAKQYLRGFTGNVYNYQAGDGFVRWTVSTASVETPNLYVIEGTSAGTYTPYVAPKKVINLENIPVVDSDHIANGAVTSEKIAPGVSFPAMLPALSLCGKDSIVATASTIAAGGSIQITDFPTYLKADGIVSFYAKISSFDEILVGFGNGGENSIQVKVDATKVYIYKSGYQSWINFQWEHGLTISDFIAITFNNDLFHPKVIVMSISGMFVKEISQFPSLEMYGLPTAVLGANTTATDAVLRATSDKFNKPIWVIGDSYTSMYPERWTYQMAVTIGIDKYLVIGRAGGGSAALLTELQKALAFGTPKFLVWGLGMNDTYSSWAYVIELVKTLCEDNGIELIMQTIPVPSLSTSQQQADIDAAIRTSGYRYIDAALAMSPNSSYPWYNGFDGGDGVHPSVLGAKAIAARVLADFPEIMQ